MKPLIVLVLSLLIIWLFVRWRIEKKLSQLSSEEINKLSTAKTNTWREERWRLRVIGEMMRRSRKEKMEAMKRQS